VNFPRHYPITSGGLGSFVGIGTRVILDQTPLSKQENDEKETSTPSSMAHDKFRPPFPSPVWVSDEPLYMYNGSNTKQQTYFVHRKDTTTLRSFLVHCLEPTKLSDDTEPGAGKLGLALMGCPSPMVIGTGILASILTSHVSICQCSQTASPASPR